MAYFVAILTPDSAWSCVMQSTLPTKGMRSIISTVSISLEYFLSSILLRMVIIVAVIIVTVIWVVIFVNVIVGVVIVVAIIGVVVFVMIIGIVVIGGGVPSIIKLSFVIIGVPVRLVGLLALAMAAVCASRAAVKSAISCRMASKVMGCLGVSRMLTSYWEHSINIREHVGRMTITIEKDELDNVVEEKDGWDRFVSIGGNIIFSRTKKYRGSNSRIEIITRWRVKIAGEVIDLLNGTSFLTPAVSSVLRNQRHGSGIDFSIRKNQTPASAPLKAVEQSCVDFMGEAAAANFKPSNSGIDLRCLKSNSTPGFPPILNLMQYFTSGSWNSSWDRNAVNQDAEVTGLEPPANNGSTDDVQLIYVYEVRLPFSVSKEAITFNLDQTQAYTAVYKPYDGKQIDVIVWIVMRILREADSFLALEDDPTSSEVDPTYQDPEGDILLLEAILNSEPPPPSQIKNNICLELGKNSNSVKLKLLNLPLMNLPRLNSRNCHPILIRHFLEVSSTHKRASLEKLSDIKGVSPEFCTHKILMEEDYEPSVQSQRRVNPKIHDVIKKEVEKLLDAGLIYPISDSPWTMNEAQTHYTTTEKELLAVVYAFEKFRSYLVMSKSIVYTDHSAIKYLFAKKDAKARLLRTGKSHQDKFETSFRHSQSLPQWTHWGHFGAIHSKKDHLTRFSIGPTITRMPTTLSPVVTLSRQGKICNVMRCHKTPSKFAKNLDILGLDFMGPCRLQETKYYSWLFDLLSKMVKQSVPT
ncbi:reverse transcriptase domain-containing protein [Tanacetum coccineum]